MYGHGQYGKVVRSQSKTTCVFANKMHFHKAMCLKKWFNRIFFVIFFSSRKASVSLKRINFHRV